MTLQKQGELNMHVKLVITRWFLRGYQIDRDEEGEQSHHVFVSEDDLLILRGVWLLG